MSSGETGERSAGVVQYMLTSPTNSAYICWSSQAAWENEDRGTEEEKVFIVASQCCDAAASAPSVTLSVSLINEPLAPMSASHRDNTDQYTMKACTLFCCRFVGDVRRLKRSNNSSVCYYKGSHIL